jgi:hypothetical protein
MKKIVALLILGLVINMSNSAVAQIKEHNLIIDPYIGFPTGSLFYAAEIGGGNAQRIGPPVSFGGRVEYMLLDNLGAGFDVNYAISGYQSFNENYFDPTTQTTTQAVYEYRVTKFRAMLRMNYHFVQTEDFDVYTGFGFGYRSVNRNATYNGMPTNDQPVITITGNWPIAFRFAIGAKYYFSKNIGTFVEVGSSGGGFVQLGLAVVLGKK